MEFYKSRLWRESAWAIRLFRERHRRARAEGKKIPMIEHVSIPLDATLVRRIEKADPNWKTRVNDILRKTILTT